MEERITCPICIDNHIKLVFQCGHASCIECSAALKTCPICRQTIRERIQLFVWSPKTMQRPAVRFTTERPCYAVELTSCSIFSFSSLEQNKEAGGLQLSLPSSSSVLASLLSVDVCYPSSSLACTVYKAVQWCCPSACLVKADLFITRVCLSLYIYPIRLVCKGKHTIYAWVYAYCIAEIDYCQDWFVFMLLSGHICGFCKNRYRCRFLFMCESWILMINILILLFALQKKKVFFLLKFTPSLCPLLRVSKHE